MSQRLRDDVDRRAGPDRRRTLARRALPIALALAAAALPGCRRAAPNGSLDTARLLVPRAPLEILEREGLTRTEPLQVVSFDGAPPGDWSVEGGVSTNHGLCVADDAQEIVLEAPAPDDVAEATDLEVVASEMEALFVELRWLSRKPGRVPYQKRISRVGARGTERDHFRFDISVIRRREPGDRIRLRILNSPSQRPCIASVAWLQVRTDPERVERAMTKPWRVELDDELRDARLAPADGAIELTLPKGARGSRLRLAFGVLGRPKRPVVFTVAPADGAAPADAARFSRRVEVEPEDADRWREIEVGPIPDDRARTLRLLAEAAPEDRAQAVVPVWSGGTLFGDPPRRPGDGEPPDIVLISIDTLRADRMSLYGNERPTSPRIDEWARRRAVVFDAAIAQATWTLPSHASMFSGLEAHHHGTLYHDPLSSSVPVVAEMLRAAGYETRAVTGAGFLDPRYGLHRGFDRYRDWGGRWGSPDEILDGTSRALAALDEPLDRPLFLFFHTYIVHGPFRPHQPYFSQWSSHPPDWWVLSEIVPGEQLPGRRESVYRMMRFPPRKSNQREPLPPEDRALAYDLYDSGVAAADEHVGRILDRLRASGRERRTLVIVTSDHGEALGEHDLAGHGFLYEDNARVPLAVALPDGGGAGRRIAEQVRLVDLVPTLLEAAGTEPVAPIDGRSLLPWLRGEQTPVDRLAPTYSGSLGLSMRLDGRWKYLFWDGVQPDRPLRDRLFDLASDPAETVDRLEEREDRARLERDALRHLADAAGLRVRLPPAAPGGGTLVLSAPWLEGVRAKWISSPDPGLRFVDGRGIVADPGGAAARLLMIHVPGREAPILTITELGADGSRAELGVRLRGDALARGALAIVRQGDALVAVEGGRTGDRILAELEWQGTLTPAGENPAATDPELERRLRALGYLN